MSRGRHRAAPPAPKSYLSDWWRVVVLGTADFWMGMLLLVWGALRPVPPRPAREQVDR